MQLERETKLAHKLNDMLRQCVDGQKDEFLKWAESERDRLSGVGKPIHVACCSTNVLYKKTFPIFFFLHRTLTGVW